MIYILYWFGLDAQKRWCGARYPCCMHDANRYLVRTSPPPRNRSRRQAWCMRGKEGLFALFLDTLFEQANSNSRAKEAKKRNLAGGSATLFYHPWCTPTTLRARMVVNGKGRDAAARRACGLGTHVVTSMLNSPSDFRLLSAKNEAVL